VQAQLLAELTGLGIDTRGRRLRTRTARDSPRGLRPSVDAPYRPGSGLRNPLERDETIGIRILVVRFVTLARALVPLAAAPTGKYRVAILDPGVHQREMDAACLRQALSIDFRAADHHQCAPRPRRDSRVVQSVDDDAIVRCEAGERLSTMLTRPGKALPMDS
jgi:hypothetical protein